MRVLSSLFPFILLAWIPAAFGLECFSIQDADQRNACLASAKRDKSYCFKIQEDDGRNAYLAEVKRDRSYCFKIQGEDLRNHCLANTPR